MENNIPSFLMERHEDGVALSDKASVRGSFVDKGLHYIAGVIKTGYVQWDLASGKGLLQKFDPRAKLFLLLFFIVIISFKRTIHAEEGIGVVILALAALSRLNVADFYRKIFFIGFFFGFLIALPASLNLITGGDIIVHIIAFPKPYDLFGYHLPQQIGVTREGMYSVAMLTLRVANSAALSLLVISTTPFPEIVKALKILKVPDVFLMVLSLTYKYIFIFARTVEEMYLAKKSRLVRRGGRSSGAEGRIWVAGRIAFIFRKTQLQCEEVFKAMLARGFSDDVRFYGHPPFGAVDWIFSLAVFGGGIFFVVI